MDQIIECVPNFSEGRDQEKIAQLVKEVVSTEGVKLLDYSSDKDHNRTVITFCGDAKGVKEAAFKLIKKASEIIDMRYHKGEHPRIGATDVVPFIPVKNATMEECIQIAREVGERVGRELNIPVYLYEEAATTPERKNLENIRRGEYEGFFEKIKQPEWKPDFGPQEMNPKSGATVIGARNFLIAYNVNLATDNIDIANKIAKAIRFSNGGYRYVKAMGVELKERGIVQVSMNLTDFNKTPIYRVFETIKAEASRYGVNVIGSEIIGLVPAKALFDVADYYLRIENFSENMVLENRIYE
ncbi:glutamate formimidoyltransferase [Thermoanaerobacter sp. CM-CNRG TB177]|jgi:glutamate formiminotransferase|uniref:glutamate formimidoyltransferase n=1 Tax=unclassified Thermoanaerobacter TaxID=2636821 RepID=UPI0000E1D988|nr:MULTISPECIES: glutamate formimidoyltransferase [unclassified Thermoanaerobacter]MBZ4656121.1 glutamate formiminotransferase [Thermoanaerobacter sp.]ABY91702.1 glutamate formiminotransferase [Thermoanaerobacter sp. X514]MBT1278721.1 glutamate formimidoyltransferase [Thermoanaerobacter sp. CM-CNRG TB177]MDI3500369.1 glutamate formiminotransferase / 5-formyltetrahydrofolate cyclo-ligase [Thermoanaerobacter sp.]HCD09552.1 glutamate formimidoyltransferase [Thermoanaerobacter sp.]